MPTIALAITVSYNALKNEGMPDYAKAKKALQALGNAYRTNELDVNAELTKLQTTLQGIFDAAPE